MKTILDIQIEDDYENRYEGIKEDRGKRLVVDYRNEKRTMDKDRMIEDQTFPSEMIVEVGSGGMERG